MRQVNEIGSCHWKISHDKNKIWMLFLLNRVAAEAKWKWKKQIRWRYSSLHTSTVCEWIIVANHHYSANIGWWLSVGRGGEKRSKLRVCVSVWNCKLCSTSTCECDTETENGDSRIRSLYFARHNNGSQRRVYFCFVVFKRLLLSQ